MPPRSIRFRPHALTPPKWLAALVAALLAGLWWANDLAAQRPSVPERGGPLWISESRLDDARRLLVVIDEVGRHAAIYHVDAAAGTLTLKSTRDISGDLSVGDFNAQEPRPGAIQRMLQLPAAKAP